MITPIGTITINQICERTGDLLVSADDVQEIARKARERAIREFAERMIDYFVDIYGCSEEIAIREIAEQILADMKKED